MRRFEDIVQYSFGMSELGRKFEAENRTCFTDTSYLPAQPINDDFEAWQNWVNSGWTATGSATLTYVNGQMQIISPDNNNHAVGAKKSFEGGTGQHTVFFELQANTCGSIIFTPPYFNPRSITVYIRDAANNVVASQSYTSTGNNTTFSFTYTPASAGTHTMEFYMANATALCYFFINDVTIQYDSVRIDTICEDLGAGYRYGFGSHEKDNEVHGNANWYTFGDYGYDPRIVQRPRTEPLTQKYPHLSPYVAFGNNPILFADLDGRDIKITGTVEYQTKALAVLQKLTDHKLAIDNEGKVSIVHSSQQPIKPIGNTLLSQLIESNNVHTIESTTGKNQTQSLSGSNESNGVGTGSLIKFNLDAGVSVITENEKLEETPVEIVIGHELIHSSHMDKGKVAIGNADPNGANYLPELGGGGDPMSNEEINTRNEENTLRKEQGRGIPMRKVSTEK